MMNIHDIRERLLVKWENGDFTMDKSGCRTIELVGTSFEADDDRIFGAPNFDYINKEIEWYESMSLSVNDIQPSPPKIWQDVSDRNGMINSNYGWCIYSKANDSQYASVLETLHENQDSRRGVMIYTRPSMQREYDDNGRSDFMCTNAVNYFIRDGLLQAVVQMRSNDVVFGFRNDFAWQGYVQRKLAVDLGVDVGPIYWNAASLHVYERHFYLVDHYGRSYDVDITKKEYRKLYPDSELA